jgi:hypothetical protein
MAIVSGQSINEWASLKPSTFALWCKMCDVQQDGLDDCYLELEKAQEIGIHRSAYFYAFNELEEKKWIEFSRKSDGKKWWKLVKGFAQKSANVDFHTEAPAEQSANVDLSPEIESINVDLSANVDFSDSQKSANVDSHIKEELALEEPQETNVSFGSTTAAPAKKIKPVKTRIPEDFELTDEMIDWAKETYPQLRLIEAHENFLEHWTNRTDAKSERVDWMRTWKKGMRLALKWQLEDDAKEKNGSNKNRGFSTKSDQWQQTIDEYGELYNRLNAADGRTTDHAN